MEPPIGRLHLVAVTLVELSSIAVHSIPMNRCYRKAEVENQYCRRYKLMNRKTDCPVRQACRWLISGIYVAEPWLEDAECCKASMSTFQRVAKSVGEVSYGAELWAQVCIMDFDFVSPSCCASSRSGDCSPLSYLLRVVSSSSNCDCGGGMSSASKTLGGIAVFARVQPSY